MPVHTPYLQVKDFFVNREGVSPHRFDMAVHELEPTRDFRPEEYRHITADARVQAIHAMIGVGRGVAPAEMARYARSLCEHCNSYRQPHERDVFANEFLWEVSHLLDTLHR